MNSYKDRVIAALIASAVIVLVSELAKLFT